MADFRHNYNRQANQEQAHNGKELIIRINPLCIQGNR